MDRSTKTHSYLPELEVPQVDGLNVPLKSSRGFFWHPLLLMPDSVEQVIALAPTSAELALTPQPSAAQLIIYKRSAFHTRLSSSQGPLKLNLRKTTLEVELFTDGYSYIQVKAPLVSSGDFPPKDAFDINWSGEDYWAISSTVSVFHIQVPKASSLCWHPRTNIQAHIKTLLEPDDPLTPLFSVAMGVVSDSKNKDLPPKRYREDDYDQYLSIFLDKHYNDSAIPPQPPASPGGTWVPQLSEDGFYFISWVFQPNTPTPTPSPTP